MADWKDALLCSIFDCGIADLGLLEDCKYDMYKIIDECEEMFGDLHINDVIRTMFYFGLCEIEDTIDGRILELEDILSDGGELDEAESLELATLRELDPFNDIRSSHNFIDTHIWIYDEDKKTDYTTYLSEALDHFYEMTGFEITC